MRSDFALNHGCRERNFLMRRQGAKNRPKNVRTPPETKIRELSGRKSPRKRPIWRRIGNGSQRIYVELTRQAAASRTTARTEVLYAAVEYKETWAVAFASYDRAGVDRPEPVPHPDDVNINYETGDVTITGPVMTEQKVARERLLAARSELEQNLTSSLTRPVACLCDIIVDSPKHG